MYKHIEIHVPTMQGLNVQSSEMHQTDVNMNLTASFQLAYRNMSRQSRRYPWSKQQFILKLR